LGNGGGGAETQGEGVGILVGGIEPSFGSSPLELSTSLEGSASTAVGFSSTHGGVGKKVQVKGVYLLVVLPHRCQLSSLTLMI